MDSGKSLFPFSILSGGGIGLSGFDNDSVGSGVVGSGLPSLG